MIFLRWLGKLLGNLLGGGILDRALDTIDRKVDAGVERDRIKADLIAAHYAARADYMRAGGKWLMLAFALPLAFWWAAVLVYSVLFCAGCAFPQSWTIAALPAPLDEWAGLIIVSIFGVIGVSRFKRG